MLNFYLNVINSRPKRSSFVVIRSLMVSLLVEVKLLCLVFYRFRLNQVITTVSSRNFVYFLYLRLTTIILNLLFVKRITTPFGNLRLSVKVVTVYLSYTDGRRTDFYIPTYMFSTFCSYTVSFLRVHPVPIPVNCIVTLPTSWWESSPRSCYANILDLQKTSLKYHFKKYILSSDKEEKKPFRKSFPFVLTIIITD